ncbi:MAG: anthranilate phosphoribosyltransferase [Bacteroidota bacterium]
MKQYIEKCLAGKHLTVSEASSAVEAIINGQASDAQVAGLLIALRCKGETVDELLGFARVMHEKAIRVYVDDEDAIDVVGTGGDGLGTFNISTVTSFVVAGAGVTVAKHGNRSVSSQSGSADVLTALGVNVQLSPEKVQACINTVGLGFMFAPTFHPAMKAVAKPRAELGVRTIFNMLGPLTNPARVKRALIGTFNPTIAEKLAGVLSRSQMKRAFVVHSDDGMDEIALSSETNLFEIDGAFEPSRKKISPKDFGFEVQPLTSIKGGTKEENATITLRVLNKEEGPHRDVVVMNSAAAIVVAGKAEHFDEAKETAIGAIDSGNALAKLKQLVEFTNRV